MIVVDGRPFPTSARSSTGQVDGGGGKDDGGGLLFSLLEHPFLASASQRLKSTPERNVSEWVAGGGCGRHVYVFQREYATVDPVLVQFIGTDEATTCVCIAIRNKLNGMTSVAHMDSPRVVDSGLIQMLSLVVDREKDSPLDVHLVGGFDDASYEYVNGRLGHRKSLGHSLPLCSKIITALRTSSEKFHICTLCVLGHNTRRDSSGEAFPVFNGLLVETSSGSIMPAQFDKNSRCPDEIVRRVRVTVSYDDPSWRGKLLETYDTKHDSFQVAACSWNPGWGSWASSLQQLSDSELLLICSTSPSAENPDFVETEKRVLSYLTRYPDWRQTFFGRKPRVFERSSDGGWSSFAT